jgi:transposase
MNYSHFVGLDVGKKTFDASLMSADEKELSHKSFDNNWDPIFIGLDSWLSSLFIQTLVLC